MSQVSVSSSVSSSAASRPFADTLRTVMPPPPLQRQNTGLPSYPVKRARRRTMRPSSDYVGGYTTPQLEKGSLLYRFPEKNGKASSDGGDGAIDKKVLGLSVKWWLLILGVVLAVAVAGGVAFWWFYLRPRNAKAAEDADQALAREIQQRIDDAYRAGTADAAAAAASQNTPKTNPEPVSDKRNGRRPEKKQSKQQNQKVQKSVDEDVAKKAESSESHEHADDSGTVSDGDDVSETSEDDNSVDSNDESMQQSAAAAAAAIDVEEEEWPEIPAVLAHGIHSLTHAVEEKKVVTATRPSQRTRRSRAARMAATG